MSNKRKKLARSIAEKTGMSYAGAVNHLRKGLRIEERLFPWSEVFVEDFFDTSTAENQDVGGFVRVHSFTVPMYSKPEGTFAFIIGDEGENIICIEKPKMFFLPLVQYKGDSDYIKKAIEERMEALVQSIEFLGAPEVPHAEVRTYMREQFEGRTGTLLMRPIGDKIVGVLDRAGIICRTPNASCGMVAFSDRIRICKPL